MEEKKTCESCAGPTKDGKKYCEHCVDENGKLKSYEDILEGGIMWAMSAEGEKIMGKKFGTREEAKTMIEGHMKDLPAWNDRN